MASYSAQWQLFQIEAGALMGNIDPNNEIFANLLIGIDSSTKGRLSSPTTASPEIYQITCGPNK